MHGKPHDPSIEYVVIAVLVHNVLGYKQALYVESLGLHLSSPDDWIFVGTSLEGGKRLQEHDRANRLGSGGHKPPASHSERGNEYRGRRHAKNIHHCLYSRPVIACNIIHS